MTLLTPDLLDTQSYGFERLRYLISALGVQEGVLDAADLKVAQRGAGANMSVDVPAGRALVRGDSGTRNGLYHVVNDATVNVPITAANATLPRLDQIVLHVRDTADLGDVSDTPTLEVLTGTPTASITLDNRLGAAALPNNCLRIADVLVPAAAASVVTANIRDRRTFARGFQYAVTGSGAGDYTTGSTAPATLAAGAFDGAFELGENSFAEILMYCRLANGATSVTQLQLNIDGNGAGLWSHQPFAANVSIPIAAYYRTQYGASAALIGPGRHTFAWQYWTTNGVNAAVVSNSDPKLAPRMVLRETPAPPNAAAAFTP